MKLSQNDIVDIANHYCSGRKPGLDYKDGLRQAAHAMVERINKGQFGAEDIHLGQLAETFVNYPGSEIRLKGGDWAIGKRDAVSEKDLANALTASEFPFITSKMIAKTLTPAYQSEVDVVEMLVREEEANRKFEDVAGMNGPEQPDRLEEGQFYPYVSDQEKSVRVKMFKFGKQIPFTRELITFEKTGGELLARYRMAGEQMGNQRADIIMGIIQDAAVGDFGSTANNNFYYNGAYRTMYSTDHSAFDNGQTNDNLITDVLGTSGLSTARLKLKSMTDINGKRLRLGRSNILLTAENIWVEGQKLVVGVTDPDQANASVRNIFAGKITRHVSDPAITDSNWFYGDFPRQFGWWWVQGWKPYVVDLPGRPENDIVFSIKYGWFGGCSATDYKLVVKSTGAG